MNLENKQTLSHYKFKNHRRLIGLVTLPKTSSYVYECTYYNVRFLNRTNRR